MAAIAVARQEIVTPDRDPRSAPRGFTPREEVREAGVRRFVEIRDHTGREQLLAADDADAGQRADNREITPALRR